MKKPAFFLLLFISSIGLKAQLGPENEIAISVDAVIDIKNADLDGDGDQDLISASINDNKIAWYENLGGGIFGPQQIISSNAVGARSVDVSDVDSDGDIDVVSASQNDNKIAWYENLGGGTFGPQQIISLNAIGARSVCASDLDGDGDPDILSASIDDDKIAWYENLGGGTFGSQQVISVLANQATSVYASDLDGDGDQDALSSSNSDGKIAWYENLGAGVFGSQQVISDSADGAQAVYASDVDGDGDVDVFSTAFVFGVAHWYENMGGGSFTTHLLLGSTYVYGPIITCDLDEDGKDDILVTSSFEGKIVWYKNLGNSSFSSENIFNVTGPYSLLPLDLDLDGDLDIVCGKDNEDKIVWYENSVFCVGEPSFTTVNNGNGNYTFTNTSLGNPSISHWAFGDGTTSSLLDPNHTFTTNGTFEVVLTMTDTTVLDGDECFDYIIDTINVTGVSSPLVCHAGYVLYPDTGINNVTIVNTATGSNLTYLWDFGDGNTSALQNPSNTYATAGPFYLCLTVDDGAGCIDQYCDSIGANGVVFKAGGFTINVIGSPIITGVDDVEIDEELMIYPNPTSTQLTIDTELKIERISVTDITGKIINSFTRKINTINVEDLSDGIYFIIIEGVNQSIVRKFVKQ